MRRTADPEETRELPETAHLLRGRRRRRLPSTIPRRLAAAIAAVPGGPPIAPTLHPIPFEPFSCELPLLVPISPLDPASPALEPLAEVTPELPPLELPPPALTPLLPLVLLPLVPLPLVLLDAPLLDVVPLEPVLEPVVPELLLEDPLLEDPLLEDPLLDDPLLEDPLVVPPLLLLLLVLDAPASPHATVCGSGPVTWFKAKKSMTEVELIGVVWPPFACVWASRTVKPQEFCHFSIV
jgi:hypothetical protein